MTINKYNLQKMVKGVILAKMVKFYNSYAYTHNYMVAFNWEKMVMVAFVNGSDLEKITILDKASRGAGNALRFKPNMAKKNWLMENCETFALCPVANMESLFESSKYNKGEIVEKLITEYFGQIWEKDNIPFTEDGDLTVDNIAYQIKYEKATFINEKQMARMAIA
jgi:hypothetical protein